MAGYKVTVTVTILDLAEPDESDEGFDELGDSGWLKEDPIDFLITNDLLTDGIVDVKVEELDA